MVCEQSHTIFYWNYYLISNTLTWSIMNWSPTAFLPSSVAVNSLLR